ncbi:MAG: ATP phosphoribosyltransferase regulatory subunit [Pseudomonadales bacterium]|jgi:ATP phosphoribosyltransferase regulatory subunit|nr:ATP phosphoribosyltransferase regulatory subunit [Pseudomonadales bacterium]MDP6469565.1 ATP phosphoribosyltransferase regulatory subunit [Pseudomonadales bacterium]MDP6827406.1 ATP phosphoribosyltransferase regulatory subunit [Pseudomonadales bacterium]MDP6971229.1 ATP phosphoribosyltransferase regulatory subunit [Pseudomonadales bacterium]
MKRYNWRLPEGVGELLPPRAWDLEMIRRCVLDLFHSWGFEYVEPPIIEYLDSLLVAGGSDLDLQTLKVVDQRSGRMMGVRADITSQTARIDAHSLRAGGITRLCYAGTVVHANPAATLESRVPIKAGAELFGDASLAADAEVVALMLESLRRSGVETPVLVVGHMGVYNALVNALGEETEFDTQALFEAVQSKSETDIAQLLGDGEAADQLVRLPTLMGAVDSLADTRSALTNADALAAVDALAELVDLVKMRCTQVELRYDLAELAGYGYHNGPVFAAFHGDHGRVLARGGRYDGVGAVFGRARPATGFDVNLSRLIGASTPECGCIFAPWRAGDGEDLQGRIDTLRSQGERVVSALAAGQSAPAGCDRQLVLKGGVWQVHSIQ